MNFLDPRPLLEFTPTHSYMYMYLYVKHTTVISKSCTTYKRIRFCLSLWSSIMAHLPLSHSLDPEKFLSEGVRRIVFIGGWGAYFWKFYYKNSRSLSFPGRGGLGSGAPISRSAHEYYSFPYQWAVMSLNLFKKDIYM